MTASKDRSNFVVLGIMSVTVWWIWKLPDLSSIYTCVLLDRQILKLAPLNIIYTFDTIMNIDIWQLTKMTKDEWS